MFDFGTIDEISEIPHFKEDDKSPDQKLSSRRKFMMKEPKDNCQKNEKRFERVNRGTQMTKKKL